MIVKKVKYLEDLTQKKLVVNLSLSKNQVKKKSIKIKRLSISQITNI